MKRERYCLGCLLSAATGSRNGMGDLEKNAILDFSPLNMILVSRKETVAVDEEEVMGMLKARWREERKWIEKADFRL